MTKTLASIAAAFALILLASTAPMAASIPEPEPNPITVRLPAPDRIEFTLHAPNTGGLRIATKLPFEPFDASLPSIEVPQGVDSFEFVVPQHAIDPVYYQYILLGADGAPIGRPQHPTGIESIALRTDPLPRGASEKGVTCPVDFDDIVALGAHHINTNLMLPSMVLPSTRGAEVVRTVLGVDVAINMDYFRAWDEELRKWAEAGIEVTVVLNNAVPPSDQPAHVFVHPLTDRDRAPNRLGAFNLTNREGFASFVAVMEFMAERYSRPDARYGHIRNYVIGNELNSHWYWYNMGPIGIEEFTDDYIIALRASDLALRRHHSDLRAFISLEHHWTTIFSFNRRQAFPGKDFVDLLSSRTREEGDFPWHVAHHPYPENLFNPAFWNDRTVSFSFDTPKITYANQEVFAAYLTQDRLLYNGEPRTLIYSEQGFHAGTTEEERLIQAAAYALASVKIAQTPGVEIHHLHRHVSHPGEGGLLLGTRDYANDDPHQLGEKYPMYYVFQAAGTERQEEAFHFALEVIGLESWDDAAIVPFDQIPERMPGGEEIRTPDDALVYDLVEQLREGAFEDENNLQIRIELAARQGVFMDAIFQHPPEEGVGTLSFPMDLPAVEEGQRLVFDFGTSIDGRTVDGVRYAVLVDGEELWHAVVDSARVDVHEVDLTPWAGSSMVLVLQVDKRANMQYDWSTWVRPQVIRK